MKIIDFCRLHPSEVISLVDVLPPKSIDHPYLNTIDIPGADFLCVAYGPGGSVRVSSEVVGATIKREIGKEVVFNIVTRDANKVGIQTQLLGANQLGLENVVVMKGDPPVYTPTRTQQKRVKSVHDFTPTELIRTISRMNLGEDFRGNRIAPPTDFCIGATINLNKEMKSEAKLIRAKLQAGAEFFITQPVFQVSKINELREEYRELTPEPFPVEVFWGIQIPTTGGEVFGHLPLGMRLELDEGKEGVQIAFDVMKKLLVMGIRKFYILPARSPAGHYDYRNVQELLTYSHL